MIYLDNSATKPLYPDVKQLIIDSLNEFGNASSLYDKGYEAYKKLEESREKIAQIINVEPGEIYFTSGGSEADTQAIKTVMNSKNKNSHIVTSSFEHPAVLDTVHQCVYDDDNNIYASYVTPNENGLIAPEDVKVCIHNNTKLVSIMAANNEIGTIQPIKEIADVVHEHDVLVHTDAVQAIGNIPIDVKELGVDMLSASGHKFGAPKGVGFLYCRKGLTPYKLIRGGQQENGYRAGTQNVLFAMAMAKALEISASHMKFNNSCAYIGLLRDTIVNGLSDVDDWRINGSMEYRLPGNLNVSFKDVSGEEIQTLLNERGFSISIGSACHSGQAEISETLKSIKVPREYVNGTIRITLSDMNTMEEVQKFIKNLKEVVEILRKY